MRVLAILGELAARFCPDPAECSHILTPY